MPREYSMGGRAGRLGGDGHGPPPPVRSLRERFGALRNLPPFLKLVWNTSRGAHRRERRCSRLVRALLPVATLYVGKLIIDEVVRLAQAGGGAGDRWATGWRAAGSATSALLLALEFGLAVLSDVLGRDRVARRVAARRAVHERHQRAPHGARGDARPRGLRGQRAPGPARPRAPPGHGPHGALEPALRPGAGRADDRRASPSGLRRLRAVAHRAPDRWPSCPRSSARRTSTRRATRSTTRARPSGASSTTCARPAPASRPRRK